MVAPKCSIHNERLLNGSCLSCAEAERANAAASADAHANAIAHATTDANASTEADRPVAAEGADAHAHAHANASITDADRPAMAEGADAHANANATADAITDATTDANAKPADVADVRARLTEVLEGMARPQLQTLRKTLGMAFWRNGTRAKICKRLQKSVAEAPVDGAFMKAMMTALGEQDAEMEEEAEGFS